MTVERIFECSLGSELGSLFLSTEMRLNSSRNSQAVLISLSDYEALEETAYLLRSPANAKHLLESLSQAVAGERQEYPLAE